MNEYNAEDFIISQMRWSFSRLNSFDTGCRYEWYKHYIECEPAKQGFFGAYGGFCHKCLEKYAKDKGYVIYDEYIDDGISGTKADRDEYQRLLADIQSDIIDLVLITKLDRIHRGLRNFLNMQENRMKKRTAIISKQKRNSIRNLK